MLFVITGEAESGKSTVANLLTSNFGFQQLAFADPLKNAAAHIFNIPLGDFYSQKSKESVNKFWGITPREMLQKLGTEGCRDLFGQDIWIKTMQSKLDAYLALGYNVAISDGRFDNEVEAVRALGGRVVHIKTDRPSTLSEDSQNHKSEGLVTMAEDDYLIYNNGTLEELAEAVKELVVQENNNA